MISAIYVVICAGILCKLSLNVIKMRRKHRVSLGDGEVKDLEVAIASHSNASQYIPISLLLLLMLDVNGASLWFINLFGIALVTGRIIHAYGMAKNFKGRVLGMQITIYNIMVMGVANLVALAMV